MENKEGESIKINAISPEAMDIESLKKSINTYLDKSDHMVRTLYDVLFLESTGHKVEIRVRESDFIKERRKKRKLDLNLKRKEMQKKRKEIEEKYCKEIDEEYDKIMKER